VKSIFEPETYEEVIKRIELLNENSSGLWGKMDVAQMLNHCQRPLAVALGRESIQKPNVFMRLLFKSFKSSMYNDTPWRKNLGTPKEYQVVSSKDFNKEKKALIEIIGDFHELHSRTKWEPHPSFGHFTHEQWGMLQYKHLDHHLRQFGV